MAGLNHQVHGELDPRVGCALPGARDSFRFPIKMKRAISVRKATLMIETVRHMSALERTIRPIILNRKNALFAGSDGGAEHCASLP